MNVFGWSLLTVVVILLVAVFIRCRSHSWLECPKCQLMKHLTFGDDYPICKECAWEEYVARIASKKHPHN